MAKERVAPLDGIRGLACLAVIGLHTNLPVLRGGWLGVDAFFVLSGFLITGLLLREREATDRISLRGFWSRRAARLGPALLITVGLCLALRLTGVFPPGQAPFKAMLLALTSTANLAPRSLGTLGPTWSLAVEEQFYLAWPVLLTFAFRSRKAVLVACAIGGSISLAACIWLTTPWGTLPHAWELLAGCALATAKPEFVARMPRWGSWLAALLAICSVGGGMLTVRGGPWSALPMLGMVIATGMVIPACLGRSAGLVVRFLSIRPLCAVGTISYGMYLLHVPVLLALRYSTSLSRSILTVVALVVTLVLAAAMFRWVERPARRLVDAGVHSVRVDPVDSVQPGQPGRIEPLAIGIDR